MCVVCESRSPATCGFFGDHGFDNKISSMQVTQSINQSISQSINQSISTVTCPSVLLLMFFSQTIFLGFGPSFNFKTEVPVFENIELYNVMCGEKIPLGLLIVLDYENMTDNGACVCV